MRVRIVQETGKELVYRKQQLNLIAPSGLPKTFCMIAFETTLDMNDTTEHLRNRALGAIGMLSAMFDERVALEELFEDWMFLGDRLGLIGDKARRVRAYSERSASPEEITALGQASLPDGVRTASRWYLKAAQQGPTSDAIIFFWVAIEMLLESAGSAVPGKLKARLNETAFDFDALALGVNKLFGARGSVVHGKHLSSLLAPAYYDTEMIVRHLLKGSLADSGWPARIEAHNGSYRTEIEEPEERRI